MNLAKIYADASGKTEVVQRRIDELKMPEQQTKEREEAARAQVKFDWLKSTVTQEMLENIGKEITTLINQAIDMSLTYHQTNNHQQIINTLVKVHTLRKVLKDYANVS